MTVKGVFLFLLLLLSCSTSSFAFSSESLHIAEQEILVNDSQFEEEAVDLYQGTVPYFKTNVSQADLSTGGNNFLLQSWFESRIQKEYLRLSRMIEPGLDIPTIIFPFHVFL